MSHTQGKLKLDMFGGVIGGDKRRLVLHGMAINIGDREKNAVANARRLVACWNICEGMPTDQLEECNNMTSSEIPQMEGMLDMADALTIRGYKA